MRGFVVDGPPPRPEYWGGITVVAAATGISRGTIAAGLRELERSPPEEVPPPRRIRRSGGGRKPTTYQDPTLLRDLERLIDPLTRGDPQSSLRWTCKSTSKLANDLQAKGHRIKERTVARLLKELDYSLQGNRKTR